MFDDATRAEIISWNERKLAQWARIAPKTVEQPDGSFVVEGDPLHLVRAGEAQTEFTIGWSVDGGFHESVIIGQLPQVHRIATGRMRKGKGGNLEAEFRNATELEKPLAKRRIDLTDAQIDAVLTQWCKNQSALDLRFIDSVYGRDGQTVKEQAA